jgi:hypothetical protein
VAAVVSSPAAAAVVLPAAPAVAGMAPGLVAPGHGDVMMTDANQQQQQ